MASLDDVVTAANNINKNLPQLIQSLNAVASVSAVAVTTIGSVTAASGTTIPAGGTAGAGFLVSATANFGIFFGSGAPTLSAAKGSLYLCSDGTTTNDRLYVNTDGSTTWTNVTTAA